MRGKLARRYIGPFRVIKQIEKVTYRLEMSYELSYIHNTFHVSQFTKCIVDDSVVVPLENIHVDDRLNYVERLVRRPCTTR